MIEWGKNAGNIEHIPEYFDEIISKICISKTSSDSTPMAMFLSAKASEWLISFRTFLQRRSQKHTHTSALESAQINTVAFSAPLVRGAGKIKDFDWRVVEIIVPI